MKPLKKTVFTLNIDNYAPEICVITYPLIKYYAHKIGADFFVINERKYPNWPVTYEKLQIYDLGREMGNDWNIYFDSDAMIHPGSPDWTNFLQKDTVAQWGSDMANLRWKYNNYFLRDGRNWGTAGWMTIGSDWCLDLWRPSEMTPQEVIDSCFPTHEEMNAGIKPEHLVDDFVLSMNVARFGLKIKRLTEVRDTLHGMKGLGLMCHLFMVSNERKVHILKEGLETWSIPEYVRNYGKEDV